jgi:hypothetical protein
MQFDPHVRVTALTVLRTQTYGPAGPLPGYRHGVPAGPPAFAGCASGVIGPGASPLHLVTMTSQAPSGSDGVCSPTWGNQPVPAIVRRCAWYPRRPEHSKEAQMVDAFLWYTGLAF